MTVSDHQKGVETNLTEPWADWLKIYTAPGIGISTFYRLISWFQTPEAIVQASITEIERVPGVSPKQAARFSRYLREADYEAEILRIRKLGLAIITLADSVYPTLLKEIYQPPPVLYAKGTLLPADINAIALVGTRRPTSYGISVAEHLALELSKRGFTIVSGLARGIDQAAHRAALSAAGRTIAVLGSGFGNIYPRHSDRLCQDIAANGVLLSEFPTTQPPHRSNFPRRNRIIAGLSLGSLVVEAPLKSGALITARYALEQGREVFAIPGKITSYASHGCNNLIQMGAKLVSSVDDILEEIEPQIKKQYLPLILKEDELQKQLDPDERKIYDLLSDEPLHIDSLRRTAGCSSGTLASILLHLELEGFIKQLPGKMFMRSIIGR
ncbi:DNA-processing protein DprA [candidate division CSSED10-310 bacterium]|uniref:DNA-processing protein DprA n=1 Tax=candidate division CSSED10-310 bacterium TaxID=2855610 RepID=A0ABV6Z6F7_UNCC1